MRKLSLKNIHKSYQGREVLSGFSYEFEMGKKYLIKGKSGIGKTTLLRIISGLEEIDGGAFSNEGNIRVSLCFQEDRLCENLSAFLNLKMVTKDSSKDEVIKNLLHEAGLEYSDGKTVKEYSGGMKRRVAIIRALIAEADAILLDEPFAGLDEETKNKMTDIINRFSKDKLLIVVSHDESDIEKLGAVKIEL